MNYELAWDYLWSHPGVEESTKDIMFDIMFGGITDEQMKDFVDEKRSEYLDEMGRVMDETAEEE